MIEEVVTQCFLLAKREDIDVSDIVVLSNCVHCDEGSSPTCYCS